MLQKGQINQKDFLVVRAESELRIKYAEATSPKEQRSNVMQKEIS